jgi:hypothetical protein
MRNHRQRSFIPAIQWWIYSKVRIWLQGSKPYIVTICFTSWLTIANILKCFSLRLSVALVYCLDPLRRRCNVYHRAYESCSCNTHACFRSAGALKAYLFTLHSVVYRRRAEEGRWDGEWSGIPRNVQRYGTAKRVEGRWVAIGSTPRVESPFNHLVVRIVVLCKQ